ncbi:peptidoglycan editing factor PgeF [Streptomonospora salina]|uniref:Purine nucleoside phosphorylase n=1 Tax=Streptomonospora salina TaxID=104205 RepID=A0A841E6H3_9ACTN|nr:peptidoglycan editing factor PgeF [Streptomonospora salina]MBB5996743.1 YfiH family protein [Streptomonospora salina]
MSAVIELGPGAHAGFTQRYDGGVSAPPFDTLNLGHGVDDDPGAVAENRRVAADRLGFPARRVVWMDQVHSARVAVADEPGSAGSVDAVVTGRDDLVLAALAADCLLVLAADAQAGIVGAAHSGRSGTRQGVAPAMVAEMARLGADPARISAVLGPAVCGSCYEVGPDVQADVARSAPEAAVRTRAGTAGVDLRAAVTAQLRAADVGHVSSDDRCTLESPELFSHRGGAPTGRFAGFVWRTP